MYIDRSRVLEFLLQLENNQQIVQNKKCFRNIYAPLGAKFKTTTYMYKAWVQPLHQVWY